MKYRPLGSSGVIVSEIGFGTWGIGGVTPGATSYGPTDDKKSREALACAFEMGINFYDTANIYGDGHSEELLGEAFRKVRSRIIIATKAGFVVHGQQNFTPAWIKQSLEDSLRRLQTDYVDLLQLHSPNLALLENSEIVETLTGLEQAGKIRFFGISLREPNDGIAAIEKYEFPVIQINFSLSDQRIIKNGLLELAKTKQIGLVGRTPLNFGFLSGKLSPGNFDPHDHRSTWSKKQQELWAKAPLLFKEALRQEKSSLVQSALRYCLSYPTSTIIPGMLTADQVKENIQASDWGPLEEKELRKIENIYNKNC